MATQRSNTLRSSLKLINLWMERLGLDKGWIIEVKVSPTLDRKGHDAEIDWVDRRANMTLCQSSMEKLSPRRWEHTLVHELCHLVTAEIEDWTWVMFSDGTVRKEFRNQQEIVVDRLAAMFMRIYHRRRT